jgi:outer membrane protein OmpA-like peptidoglycan-associated protein
MSMNLLENITSYLTPDLLNKASAYVGETPANTSKAMSAIIPTLLNKFAGLASTPSGANQLTDMLRIGGIDGSILNNLSGVFSGGPSTVTALSQGKEILGTLLGQNTGTTSSAVSNFSGITSNSAHSLMALAVPLILGVLGKLKSVQALPSSGLADLLVGQRASFASAVPSGFTSAMNAFDVQGLQSVTVAPVVQRPAGPRLWPLLLILPLLALGLFAYLHGRGPRASDAVAMEQVQLCNGQSLSLLRDSFNYNLARYLANGSSAELPKTFVFDHLNFDSATTTLTPESRTTVNDLIVVLKACPTAQVQLAGHTDSTGDPTSNQTLSQNRAEAVQAILVGNGISADRITTIGYGQDRPIASNDTEDGKARNRRTELVVLKK